MGVKFSMRSAAPSDHARRTESSGVDPGAMAAPFPEAAEPVATSTNGPVSRVQQHRAERRFRDRRPEHVLAGHREPHERAAEGLLLCTSGGLPTASPPAPRRRDSRHCRAP
ncbi:hypothetical protein HMPREF0682_1847 [Propionibacterium acidifaciens F0233]|uniref:Uncharacterized protein n=1 Tax=Propionibacterium acidifaciens F0233 TaxID=553198 RepID=U2QDD0_9ACTN|nr:hypothetical protein HMPREF0682_1847 [Propionibacterium acidifaciens F0233]